MLSLALPTELAGLLVKLVDVSKFMLNNLLSSLLQHLESLGGRGGIVERGVASIHQKSAESRMVPVTQTFCRSFYIFYLPWASVDLIVVS